MEQRGEVTELLERWRRGDAASVEPLFKLVYPRLRRIAQGLFRGESPGSLLQPTGIVNELYLKLVQQRRLDFANREHFFSLAAALMRRLLVDHARSEQAQRRTGGIRVPLEDGLAWVASAPAADLLDFDQALKGLGAIDPRKAQMFEIRFFLGATSDETAEIMQLSRATVERDLKFARAWLGERLR